MGKVNAAKHPFLAKFFKTSKLSYKERKIIFSCASLDELERFLGGGSNENINSFERRVSELGTVLRFRGINHNSFRSERACIWFIRLGSEVSIHAIITKMNNIPVQNILTACIKGVPFELIDAHAEYGVDGDLLKSL